MNVIDDVKPPTSSMGRFCLVAGSKASTGKLRSAFHRYAESNVALMCVPRSSEYVSGPRAVTMPMTFSQRRERPEHQLRLNALFQPSSGSHRPIMCVVIGDSSRLPWRPSATTLEWLELETNNPAGDRHAPTSSSASHLQQ